MVTPTPETLREFADEPRHKLGERTRKWMYDHADAWGAAEKYQEEYARLWHRDAERLRVLADAVRNHFAESGYMGAEGIWEALAALVGEKKP